MYCHVYISMSQYAIEHVNFLEFMGFLSWDFFLIVVVIIVIAPAQCLTVKTLSIS